MSPRPGSDSCELHQSGPVSRCRISSARSGVRQAAVCKGANVTVRRPERDSGATTFSRFRRIVLCHRRESRGRRRVDSMVTQLDFDKPGLVAEPVNPHQP